MQPPRVVGAFRMSAVSTISPFMIEPSRIARPLRLGATAGERCDFRQRRDTYRVLDDRGLQSRVQSSPLILGGVALACRRGVVRLGTVPPPSLVGLRRVLSRPSYWAAGLGLGAPQSAPPLRDDGGGGARIGQHR